MTLTLSATFGCDNPSCPGDGTHTPAQATTPGSLPAGWIQFSGIASVGTSTNEATNYFDRVSCAASWFNSVVTPGMVNMGATRNGP